LFPENRNSPKRFHLRDLLRPSAATPRTPEEPIRSELFSVERLEQHAESLAAAQPVTIRPVHDRRLARRLRDNGRTLLAAYRTIGDAIRQERTITPAAEWLVDNFHVIEEQIREIRDDLPRAFYRQLPKLADGPFEGYPRVFGIAWAFVAHTDSLFDPETLCRFVRAYQRVQPLTIGELWAVAIALRMVLVENLRRSADRIVSSRIARQQADALADRLLGVGREADPASATLVALDAQGLSTPFAVQLLQRLREQDPVVTPALRWLDDHLRAHGTDADRIVREEHQQQGAMNVTVRNAITSMRLISAVDWTVLFESVSLVDAKLGECSDFAAMDFPTRDHYRHAIELLARASGHSELEVTGRAIEAAQCGERYANAAGGDNPVARDRDPGHYLIGGGRLTFEKDLGFRAPREQWLPRAYARLGIFGYLGSVAVVCSGLLALALFAAAHFGVAGSTLAMLALVGLIPASDAALALINRHVTRQIGATLLPALELRGGIPPSLRTIVVVPTMLTTLPDMEEQIERLEVRHLASAEDDLRFALLSDWADSDSETAAGDDLLLAAAAGAIAELNQRYAPAVDGERFLLLHRRRVWNASEGKWMGWERKRGKLHELNRLLRGATDTTFVAIAGKAPELPPGVRFVITLDADTRLPRDAARRLVGKMAHPLNRPELDPRSRRVVEGYAVLQPRVTPSLPIGREGSIFQRVFSGPGGCDPYASAVSDVYQDLFGEGSFTGKGIYDVDVFEAALAGRIPDNAVLSHDLLEGNFARAGLVTDIEVVEEFPSRYDVAAARQHRWARGDWQLLPWILGRGRQADPAGVARVAGEDGRRRAHTQIPLVARWKMLDNLRRTLSPPAAFLALLSGWLLPPAAAAAWTVAVLLLLALPPLLPVFSGLLPPRLGISKRSHLRNVAADVTLALAQIGLMLVLLAHQTWLMLDAIVRTFVRLLVTHRHMLEWFTAAQAKFSLPLDVPGFYLRMIGGVSLACGAAALVMLAGSGASSVAAPFVLLWAFSPVVAQWVSRPPLLTGPTLVSTADALELRRIARRTWSYFETFVTSGDSMLPPDNFQEIPKPVVAHRTSPTNMGLYLLSAVAARDLGWSGTVDVVERLEATLAAMGTLERFRGHFYNWYATEDLRPLHPKYVSSVDSGNLAGHLVALTSACREMAGRAASARVCMNGIADAVALTRESLAAVSGEGRIQTISRKQFDEVLAAMETALGQKLPETPVELSARLAVLAADANTALDIARTWAAERAEESVAEVLRWTVAIGASIRSHQRDLDLLRSADGPALLDERLGALADVARKMVDEMEFGFLFDPARQLLSIGFLVVEGTLDPSCYDLLASEARLASFLAIAKGDVPMRHWFRLGRSLTPVDRGSALISWSGSMFEYLMPSLVMRAATGSLLAQTNALIVRRQMHYGAEQGVPWGVSESAYNARDLEFTYQYSNFGVPGLGLKRGLSQDVVVAPYATALAAMVDPDEAVKNFTRLAAAGGRGRYGFYEALDFTPTRLPEGEPVAVVRAYMAHHQGMTIVAIANALQDGAMRARFHASAMVQATELLLQERTPRGVAVARPRAEEVKSAPDVRELLPPMTRRFRSPHDRVPRTHLLSNGRYSVMLTNAGSGYSRWGDLAVTRWREDVTLDPWGSFVFLRDRTSGALWSAGYQPTAVEPDSYQVSFSEDRAEISRRDGTMVTTLEVAVSPEADSEVRRVSLTNVGSRTREIEVTSYAEVVLATPAADTAHPAFSKLFVQTEYVEDVGTLLATRRRRSPGDAEVWAAHLVVTEGECIGPRQYETDRARFLGRGHGIRRPVSIVDGEALSNTVGTVLDPVFSLRCSVRVQPGATVRLAFWTLAAASRTEALDLADKHHDPIAFDRVVTLAWTQAQVQLHHLGVGPDEAQLFQRLANGVLYNDPGLRPSSEVLQRNQLGQRSLWPHGISGDLPIVLVRIDEIDDMEIIRQLLRAHAYWRLKCLAVDLVILNERPSSYSTDLQGALEAMLRASQSRIPAGASETRGSVFVLRADLISLEMRNLLESAARAVLRSRRGSLFSQMQRSEETSTATSRNPTPLRSGARAIARVLVPARQSLPTPVPAQHNLEFFNGIGGFSDDGKEYVTHLDDSRWTPAPWINVVSNPCFGFQTSMEGCGYTWSVNSRENQITPWSNDPVTDRPGEAIYLRDEDSGALWGPTARPIRLEESNYLCRHGQGYSRFEHTAHGIAAGLLQYVAAEDPIKITRLQLRNLSSRTRRLSVTAYVEWVLAATRTASSSFLATAIDAPTGAMLARNRWRTEFGERVAFADLAGRQTSWTGDRSEFLGRNGAAERPAALESNAPLSNRTGAGLDPCGAMQTRVELRPGEATEIVFLLGETATTEEARTLVERYRKADLDAVFAAATAVWDDVLSQIQVRTPDRAMDILLNRWLLYQTLACRVWARSAFYQASGAYGFRDQLQDVMALLLAAPHLAREQLVRASARQFVEGDVQHWWLPPAGQGVRTHVSDDRLWLPYVAAHYIRTTGDTSVLDENTPFLDGPVLGAGEADSYFQPMTSETRASVFEHCARAIDRSLDLGSRGLPLMGGGDWNDGMNHVGAGGQGESVWLGWFLHATLTAFTELAAARGETLRASAWTAHAAALAASLEREAWDGGWYRRGTFDDGSLLGSASSEECRIDSIAQSWAVISGVADRSRARTAMEAVSEHLVRETDGLSMLFTPPFDRTGHEPGYIKGYPPGIRENGGQYTHAAAWSVIAFADLGDGDKAVELFSLLNPIRHASTRAGVQRYKVEPYVMSADVYSQAPHVGRGGWTWYTGSAGWMQRAGIEWILGLSVRGTTLRMNPCVPKAWPGFEMVYRHHSARYEITVENPRGAGHGVTMLELDGVALSTAGDGIELVDDAKMHRVRVVLG